MIGLQVIIDGDGCWPDLKPDKFIKGKWTGIARLKAGTTSDKSTVTVRIELPDGQVVLAETTMALLSTAIKAFEIADKR